MSPHCSPANSPRRMPVVKSKTGKPYGPKSVRHQYGTLVSMFGYAASHDMLVRNPMDKVHAPKKVKRPVAALNQTETQQMLDDLPEGAEV